MRILWTKPEERFLKDNHENYSMPELAIKMTEIFKRDITNLAIKGKIKRMGLVRVTKTRKNMTQAPAVLKDQKVKIKHRTTLMKADNNTCRFSTDEPRKGGDMGICGKPVFKQGHCEECHKIAFRKVRPKTVAD